MVIGSNENSFCIGMFDEVKNSFESLVVFNYFVDLSCWIVVVVGVVDLVFFDYEEEIFVVVRSGEFKSLKSCGSYFVEVRICIVYILVV